MTEAERWELNQLKHKLAEQTQSITKLEMKNKELKGKTKTDRPQTIEDNQCACVLF